MEKLYLTYNQIHKTVALLARQIQKSGFVPDLMVAIGTGGFIPARMLKTHLKIPILTLGIAFYNEENRLNRTPQRTQWIDDVEEKLKGKSILLVDEVDDTRSTLEYCLKELLKSKPAEIAVAVLHRKNKPKVGVIPPEIQKFWAGEEFRDPWICYPWDAIDIEAHDTHTN